MATTYWEVLMGMCRLSDPERAEWGALVALVNGDPLPDEDEPDGPTRASWQRGALSALRRAEVELGAAQHQLRNAGLPASMRAVERTKERVTRLRHNIEDGKKR